MSNKKVFLRQTAIYNSLGAAFQRAKIYVNDVSEIEKDKLKDDMAKRLEILEQKYILPVSSEEHYANIKQFADELTIKYKRILEKRRFRVGIAQKAINIYLKLIWCYGWIEEPPHCPIDSVVLRAIGDSETKWTKIESIKEYRKVIEKLHSHISREKIHHSMSEWELEEWNRR